MVLGFKQQFVPKIIDGTKIHTIRRDEHRRWQKGVRIHFATGVRTKDYKQFKVGVCKFNQAIHTEASTRSVWLGLNGGMHKLSAIGVDLLAKNDGFDSTDEFWQWFSEDFQGVIVHWTDFVYG